MNGHRHLERSDGNSGFRACSDSCRESAETEIDTLGAPQKDAVVLRSVRRVDKPPVERYMDRTTVVVEMPARLRVAVLRWVSSSLAQEVNSGENRRWLRR